MTLNNQVYNARIVSSVAATVISLACGTNVRGSTTYLPTQPIKKKPPSWIRFLTLWLQYVYSAWAPQFADKLLLSATESNLIGLAGNLGMYSMGVPVGIFVDSKGPRPAVIVGSILLGLGYYPLHQAYDAGHGSVPWLCFVSYLTGLGGCMAFAAAVKTSALNWPHHRGTATAFPLAAFGLSAFFFALVGSIFFPGSPSKFLELLAGGTFGLTFVGFFFLRVLPPHAPYHAVPDMEPGMTDSRQLHRTTSEESKNRAGRGNPNEPGTLSNTTADTTTKNNTKMTQNDVSEQGDEASGTRVPHSPTTKGSNPQVDAGTGQEAASGDRDGAADETSSLLSQSTCSSSLPGEVLVQSSVDMDRSHRVDIRGINLMKNIEFWQLFTIMAILSGIGLMTIK